MENCCCRSCEFNAGTSSRGDAEYAISQGGAMPYDSKFDGPGEETVKYGEKL
jgi:hypothetical protein